MAIGDQLDLVAINISPSSNIFPNKPQDALDLANTEERVERSYDPQADPGDITDLGAEHFEATAVEHRIRYSTRKQYDPELSPSGNSLNGITLFSPATGAAGMWRDVTAALDRVVTVVNSSERGFEVDVPVNFPAGNEARGHWRSNASI